MNRSARLALLLLVGLAACLYFPLNRLLSGGYNLQLPLDAWVPVLPVFAVPYLLCLPYWLIFFVVAAWRMEDGVFRPFMLGSLFAILVATAFYIFLPTYTDRPLLAGDGWAMDLLRQIYANDQAYNAFPSGHVLFTTLIALFGADWRPGWGRPLAASVVLVILSTLFTGQHHLVDPLGGLVLAWGGHRFGLWAEAWWRPQPRPALVADVRPSSSNLYPLSATMRVVNSDTVPQGRSERFGGRL